MKKCLDRVARYVTRADLCVTLDLSYSSVQRLERAGIIVPVMTLGGRKRYDPERTLKRLKAAKKPNIGLVQNRINATN